MMKLHSGLDARHLMQMLGDALLKEQEQWLPKAYCSSGPELTGDQRDEAVNWLLFLNSEFHFTPETFCLSVSILDRFLHLVKVRPKYLHCVAICCFYIASKTLEEDEVIPSTIDLVKKSRCEFSVSEILRMEAIILNKLCWNIKTMTPVDFLHIFYAMLMYYHPKLLDCLCDITPTRHLCILSRKLFSCIGNHQLLTFRPVTLTLAVISLELEQITPCWLSIMCMLQQMTEVDNESLIQCREAAGEYLTSKQFLPTGYLFKAKLCTRPRSVKRKVEQIDAEDDDIYDSIKRLYNEDFPWDKSSAVIGTCGSEIRQDLDTVSYSQITTVGAN